MTDVDRPSLSLPPALYSPTAPGSSSAKGPKVWQDGDTTSFKDVLAVINPLQHLPIVGTIYRAITGDQIATMPSIIGGAIFGGPIGLALSLADNAIKAETGMRVGESALAFLGIGTPPATEEPQQLIAAAPPGKQPPANPSKLVIDIPAPRPGEQAPQPFADGKPPVVINLPQPKWALEAAARGTATPGNPGGLAGQQAQAPQPAMPATPVKAGMPLQFQNPAAGGLPPTPISVKAPIPKAGDSPLANARFRSTDLPQPQVDGGRVTHTGADLVPTPGGTAISRDAVPGAMQSALDKYAVMMRARNAQQTPTQVSVLR